MQGTASVFSRRAAVAVALLLAAAFPAASAGPEDDNVIALSLAEMLRAGRTVVSNNQDRINDPAVGNKGLTAEVVVAEAIGIYRKRTGTDPMALDPSSRHGRLLRAQIDSIAEVVSNNQTTLNAEGVGFKGFIPATFARLVNEAFGSRMASEAEVKVTAPRALVRNRKTRPDAFEAEVIATRLLANDWPKGQIFAADAEAKGRQAYRVLVPEYYGASCLSCHGAPKGEVDLTGYPKEGGKEGDLGGVISLTLYK